MRTSNKLMPSLKVGIASVLVAVGLVPARLAHAQIDVTPPMPNVLILLDTSGSMTRKMGNVDADADGQIDLPNCTTDADVSEGRWFAVVQALTGEVPDLECESFDRVNGGDFETLFGTDLYDTGYYLPFQQIQASGCGYVPGMDPTYAPPESYRDFPNNAIVPRAACAFDQTSNGIIDQFKRQVRFGLMTFDPATDERVGNQNGASQHVDTVAGHAGTWSYWFEDGGNNYENGNGFAEGKPVACGALLPMEVGARGPAAPPWEGRLMGFGNYDADSQEVADQNERIEKVLLSMRPYGATPLAGMLSDARDFLLNDTSTLGNGANAVPLGPTDDPYWDDGAGCRPTHIIVITDGEPNLDLRPDCELDDAGGDATLDGVCPFESIVHADDGATWFDGFDGENSIVNRLAQDNDVTFHVIGVSLGTLSDPPAANCADYSSAPGPGRVACASGVLTAEERTCCTLNAIAAEGGTGDAHFVNNLADLQTALSGVLTEIASGTATRTAPVFQSVTPTFHVDDTDANAVGHEVLSSLKTTVGDGLWGGRLERIRFACDIANVPPFPEREDFDRNLGDDFGFNMALTPGNRFMITAEADTGAQNSWASLRPDIAAIPADGMTKIDANPVANVASAWVNNVDPAGLDLSIPSCVAMFGAAANTPAGCRSSLLTWYAGMASTASGGDRCPDVNNAETCKTLGAIYHSQPIVVGPPREFLRDESYDVFAKTFEARPTVVYAASVDGQVHAFMLADNTSRIVPPGETLGSVDSRSLNELWSFVPPIALPFLKDGVNRHQILLDGGLVAKNVVFERTVTDAQALVADFTLNGFRTVLVGSSGNVGDTIPGGGYYYALDVTDPHADVGDFDGGAPTGPLDGSPKFLWQISRGEGAVTIDQEPLFGDSVPAAAVTTIAYTAPSSGLDPREIAVAILAGGLSDTPAPLFDQPPYPDAVTLGSDPGTRNNRNWGPSRSDRSITIVRIDTGEVLARFRGLGTDPAPFAAGVMTTGVDRAGSGSFYAPMSGTPVAFPGLPGQISTRVFIGDADGVLWQLDLSDPDPTNWNLRMAWDAYHDLGGSIGTGPGEFLPAPVETVPVLSVDADGNPVVVYATGSQEDFYRPTGKNFVVAIRDNPDDATAGFLPAWEIDLEDNAAPLVGGPGQRVTGPLNIFDGKVFFATYVPDGDPCTLGAGRIWGVNYLDNPLVGIMGPFQDQLYIEDPLVIAFGVTIGQQPACRNVTIETADDSIFGRYTKFESTLPGTFELRVQSGRRGTANNVSDESTKVLNIPLDTPMPTVKVDSWAAIVE